MSWEMMSMVGAVAFAISGAIIAMEEDYDIFGVFLLGMVTAFGGGAVRNLLIGVPVSELWNQQPMFLLALIAITIVFLFPQKLINPWNKWGQFFDAIGLSAFAIQGAIYATDLDLPVYAVVVAAVLTGSGGGMIRDILAGRKPLVLKSEIYALWAMIAGVLVYLGAAESPLYMYGIFVAITTSRILSYTYKWRLPRRTIKKI